MGLESVGLPHIHFGPGLAQTKALHYNEREKMEYMHHSIPFKIIHFIGRKFNSLAAWETKE